LQISVKHSPRGGRIILSAMCEGESVIIRVDDSGTGIPVPERERMFERF
jgi:signal transduction histidine kinase